MWRQTPNNNFFVYEVIPSNLYSMPERNFSTKTISLRFSSCQNHSNEKSVTHTHTLDEFHLNNAGENHLRSWVDLRFRRELFFIFIISFLRARWWIIYFFLLHLRAYIHKKNLIIWKFLNDDGKAVKPFKNSSS